MLRFRNGRAKRLLNPQAAARLRAGYLAVQSG
jgi:hypothetical protein